ncbi:MAG TPA: family 10 glycosylhydrolase [Phycisphaerae bacterium]|nr:family 10 glycosylhydrolase [Phycisphaerae bacterium]
MYDAARMEHLMFIRAKDKNAAGPTNNWVAPEKACRKAAGIFKDSMRDRVARVCEAPKVRSRPVGLSAPDSRAGGSRRRRGSPAFACLPLILGLLTGCPPQGPIRPAPPTPTPQPTIRHEPPIRPPDPRSVWPPRAIWVVRQAYRSPDQVIDIIDRCARAGFNTVLFQVRGNGTAFYRSLREPWSEEFPNGDPGFDPLAVAVTEAHRRGMALHAWVNVMPGWRGSGPPRDPRQLYNTHRDWFLRDQTGRLQPLGGFYVSVNPCLPEVRSYLVDVFEEIVTGYRVDGLHLDYIRCPLDKAPQGSDYPHDARTLQLYRQATGGRPQDSRSRWTLWRQQQVTQLVRDIRSMCQRRRPGLRLTAACKPDIDMGRNDSFQDGPLWLNGNLVDAVFVMNYTADTGSFRRRQEAWMKSAPDRWVIPGLGAYTHGSDAVTIAQLDLADSWKRGFAFFSSNSLFDNDPRSRQRLNAVQPRLLDLQRRAAGR